MNDVSEMHAIKVNNARFEKCIPKTLQKLLVHKNSCFSTLPTNLCLKPSNLVKGEYDVWSEEVVPIGTRFGPYEGIFIETAGNEKEGFQQKVEEKEKKIMTSDGCNTMESNWLKFVNYTSCKELQNMIAVQQESNVYYLTSKSIPANTELLVLYRDETAEDTSKDKGYNRNDYHNAGDTEEDTLKINQISRDNKEKHIHTRKENKHITLETEILHESFLNNVRLIANTFKLDLKQDKYEKCTKLESQERNHTCEIYKKNYLEEKKLTYGKRLELGKTHTVPNFYKCIRIVRIVKKCIEGTELNMHQWDDTIKPYKCNVCQKKFASCHSLKRHERIHARENPNKCNICQKKFIRRRGLIMHQRIHSGEMPYECNICVKKFNSRTSFLMHERIHTGEKHYECHICKKKFSHSQTLKLHERIHTGKNLYECHICKKKFTQSRTLKLHERIHTGEKPYECCICEKKFVRSESLKVHEQIHTGEKPYACSVCEKKFNYKHCLISHERTHTEKPYSCNVCQKKFKIKKYLIVHERIHSGEKPYECNVCQKKFTRSGNLKKHERRTHTGEKSSKCNTSEKKI